MKYTGVVLHPTAVIVLAVGIFCWKQKNTCAFLLLIPDSHPLYIFNFLGEAPSIPGRELSERQSRDVGALLSLPSLQPLASHLCANPEEWSHVLDENDAEKFLPASGWTSDDVSKERRAFLALAVVHALRPDRTMAAAEELVKRVFSGEDEGVEGQGDQGETGLPWNDVLDLEASVKEGPGPEAPVLLCSEAGHDASWKVLSVSCAQFPRAGLVGASVVLALYLLHGLIFVDHHHPRVLLVGVFPVAHTHIYIYDGTSSPPRCDYTPCVAVRCILVLLMISSVHRWMRWRAPCLGRCSPCPWGPRKGSTWPRGLCIWPPSKGEMRGVCERGGAGKGLVLVGGVCFLSPKVGATLFICSCTTAKLL